MKRLLIFVTDLTNTMHQRSPRGSRGLRSIAASTCLGLVAIAGASHAKAQAAVSEPALLSQAAAPSAISSSAGSELPDAPDTAVSPASSAYSFGGGQTAAAPRMAGPYEKYIEPNQPVPQINAHDKFILGVRDAVSPFSFAAWVIDAGYEQLTDTSPNYGHNSVAFGQRFGAGAARDFTQGVLGDSILAPLLHEDPRYYKMGPGHPFLHRVVYAGTRALITKTDSGRTTVNISQIGGNLGGAILTNVYYPQTNRGFTQTMETFGGSVGGSALGFVVSEFLSGWLSAVHLNHISTH